VLLGPSGCGKTTVLRIIAGFQVPTTGPVFIDRQDITGVPANRRDIGFVFQNYALFSHLTVQENVAYGLRVRRPRTGSR
jgi:iron(III) transport system ATP-binding protein